MFEGERVARTMLAQAYPPKLSIAYGTLMSASLEDRRQALLTSPTMTTVETRLG